MGREKRSRIKARLRGKTQKVKQKSWNSIAQKLKEKIPPTWRGILQTIITAKIIQQKLVRDFIVLAKNDGNLLALKNRLSYLGFQSMDDFLKEIDINKFLTTGYDPKGTINEVLILNDPEMMKILIERAKGSMLNISFKKKNELSKIVTNVFNKNVKLADFQNKSIVKATNFKTFPNNKLYSDFSLVQYDSASNSLLIILPGEIKEPSAAKTLKKQLANYIRRMKSSTSLTFDIDGTTKNVPTTNVFFVRDNAIGIARRKIRTPAQSADQIEFSLARGKNITVKTPVLEVINITSRKAIPKQNAKQNQQEFTRLLVQVNPEVSPDRILKSLKSLKKKVLIDMKSTK